MATRSNEESSLDRDDEMDGHPGMPHGSWLGYAQRKVSSLKA
jgi:hypothetical protein